MFEKILVLWDGSELSVRALENAVQIAKKFESKITLLYAYQPYTRPVDKTRGLPLPSPEEVEARRKIAAGILADGGKKVKAEGVQVETLFREGHVHEEILRTVREGKFDLIVTGSLLKETRLSLISEMFLGSISNEVIRHARCPVLVVK
jgi:nucleotide-binding universal stress UspA family protein